MVWLDDHSNPSRIHAVLRTVALPASFFGWLVGSAGFFAKVWDRHRGIRFIHRNPDVVFWLRIAAVILFLGVLPLVCLWSYQSHGNYKLRPLLVLIEFSFLSVRTLTRTVAPRLGRAA
jgi:hypothetical protein